MLGASIAFFFLSLISLSLAISKTAGIGFEAGRLMFFVLLGVAIAGFIVALVRKEGGVSKVVVERDTEKEPPPSKPEPQGP